MNFKRITLILICLFSAIMIIDAANSFSATEQQNQTEILSYIVNPYQQQLKFYYKDNKGENYASLGRLAQKLRPQNQQVIFAVNGGMYDKKHKPKGLYIENNAVLSPLDKVKKGYGNFYLQPNGVFYLNNNGSANISTTDHFSATKEIKYATQSGPMLVIDGDIHPKFLKKSNSLNIRNGVGILPNGNLLFAMSKGKVNFYTFALFFKEQGCKQALYLDGHISKTYLPSKSWEQLEGNFAVIIAEINRSAIKPLISP